MNMFEIGSFIFGLIVGSFLNVCIYRLPREMSIVTPPSSCPTCKTAIRPWDNIPVVSYLLLRGRCRKCGEKISSRYPAVELANGVLYWFVAQHFGAGWHLPFLFSFVSAMIVITFIDFDFQIIPDVITIPGTLIGIAGATFFLPDPFDLFARLAPFQQFDPVLGFKDSLIGAFTGYGIFFLIATVGSAIARTDALGGGDLKMMAMVGAFTGWKGVVLTTFLGSLIGSFIGVSLMILKGRERKMKIPFGPFLALGSLVSLFFGGEIVQWYLGLGQG